MIYGTQEEQNEDDESGEIVDVEHNLSDNDEMSIADKFAADRGINVQTRRKPKKTDKAKSKNKVKTPKKRNINIKNNDDDDDNDQEKISSALESSASEVDNRLASGCECQGQCFKDFQAETVYRHRLNIAELSKQEHDMYLMGITMACLADRKETNRHKERIRQRATYVYQGKRVCLDAFLYLENVTHYHLKRIRRHVMLHGVTPRVHGNVRKKPHNALPLDIYKFAENFVKTELLHHTNDLNKSYIVVNEPRINIYQKFRENGTAENKLMSYSTFRHFLKKQFPHVRFVINRPIDGYANRDKSKIMKRERINNDRKSNLHRKVIEHGGNATIVKRTNFDNRETSDCEKVYYDEIASDVERNEPDDELYVEYIDVNDSYESDANDYDTFETSESKNDDYQEVDFLDLDD